MHTHVVACPQGAATGADSRVPGVELAQRDTILVGNGLALVTGHHGVELVTVGRNACLDGLGSGDAIASGGSRLAGSNDSSLSAGDQGGLIGGSADTEISVCPHALAACSNGRVPAEKLVKGDAVEVLDGGTVLAARDKMELVAVANHTGLGGRRGGNAISGRGSGGGRDRSRNASTANNADANVGVGPESLAVGADGRVPTVEVGPRETIQGLDGGATLAGGDEMELVAVLDHALLGRRRRDNAVTNSRSGGRTGSDCGGGLGLLLFRGTPVLFSAVGLTDNEGAGGAERRILSM